MKNTCSLLPSQDNSPYLYNNILSPISSDALIGLKVNFFFVRQFQTSQSGPRWDTHLLSPSMQHSPLMTWSC
jgi:hypothetical protein